MQHEKSCGALVLRRGDDGKLYILMKLTKENIQKKHHLQLQN